MDRLDLSTLLDQEPPLNLTAEMVATGVRRRRARWVTGWAVGTTAVLAIGVTAVSNHLWRAGGSDSLHAASAPTSTVVQHPPGGPRSQLVQKTVVDNSPVGWTYDFVQGLAPNDDGIDGTVDDGDGKSRTYVSVTHEPGNLTPEPCKDPEFVGSGTCTATALGAGRTLIQRTSAGGLGVVTVVAGVLHSDGTGIYAESTNAWWPHMSEVLSGERSTAERKAALAEPEITRATPAYSLEQLVRIVEAVDTAVFGG